jgi:hypothetical protein
MRLSTLLQRWGLFAATVFLLIGMTLAWLQAGPVAGEGVAMRYAFWMATAVATFVSWWLSQWLVVSGRERLSRTLLVVSSLVATLLYLPWSLALDALFGMPDTDTSWWSTIIEEWLASALPVFSGCMIASLPAWLLTTEPVAIAGPAQPSAQPSAGSSAESSAEPPPAEPATGSGLLPIAVRGGVLRATADLQYVHLQSPEGVTTVPGPMHRVIALLGDHGLEVRRGQWIADRHVKQAKSVRGRWVVLLKDGQQVSVSRRRLTEVKERWGSTRYT